ncbi:hypothetical protein [Sulfurisphaera ohwakuensis]|uniref:hypothetical protein n=1 Tax=Sulfurisphaera ohwakuensis TaxID=69656 RepID=UPI0036F4058C
MRRFTGILISVVIIAIRVYLFMIDKPTIIHPPKIAPFNKLIINYGDIPAGTVLIIPLPWYANPWPETAAVGIVLLISALSVRRN